MTSTLSRPHQATYESIFRHPVAHNLEWRDLVALFRELGDVEEQSNGSIRFSRNGHSVALHTHGKDVGVREIMNIRHFLERSEAEPSRDTAETTDVLVVLDHSGARLWQMDGEPGMQEHIVPLDPLGHDKQVHNPKGDSGGKQFALRKLFYEDLVEHLEEADRILFMGDGQGASSEFDRFLLELRERHHEDLIGRIYGVEVIDISHLTEGELLAKSREFFASLTV